MKPNIKKLWVEALRSGKYKQGSNCLRKKDEFCCLGVLCDLHRKKNKKQGWELGSTYYGADQVLPPEIQQWAGLDDNNPEVRFAEDYVGGRSKPIANFNDNGATFEQLAKMIEEQL